MWRADGPVMGMRATTTGAAIEGNATTTEAWTEDIADLRETEKAAPLGRGIAVRTGEAVTPIDEKMLIAIQTGEEKEMTAQPDPLRRAHRKEGKYEKI